MSKFFRCFGFKVLVQPLTNIARCKLAPVFVFSAFVVLSSCQWVSSEPKKGSKTGDTSDTDYWEDVRFSWKSFDRVIEIIKKNYIEPSYDQKLAFVYAANYALLSMEEPQELVTVSFYKKYKDLPEERNLLAGQVKKLKPKDAYYIHVFDPKAKSKEEEKFSSLKMDDLKILEEINRQKKRTWQWNKSWSDVSFGKEQFKAIVDYVKKTDKTLDEKTILVNAVQGYLRSLDPHSSVISALEWKEATQNIEDASFEGIGALLRREGKFTMIETPLNENQPAYKAGLLPGDIIIKVDGKSIESMSLHKVVKLIRGPKGKAVVLTIRRKGHPKDFDVSVVRAFVKLTNVESKLVKELPSIKDLPKDMLKKLSGMGYIKITGFVDTTLRSLLSHFQKLSFAATGHALKGMILDLRNNAGGKLDQAIQISDVFLPRGSPIVSVRYSKAKRANAVESFVAQLPALINKPIVVLINPRSASASEIMASAIQDNRRGIVVGERSYGKGSVQNLVPNTRIGTDYYVKLTIGRFFAPSGYTIQAEGITPDFPVKDDPKRKFVYYYREENSVGHLKPIPHETPPRNIVFINKAKQCITQIGISEKTLKRLGKTPKLKPDHQLLKAIDILRCQLEGKLIPPKTQKKTASILNHRTTL